jgi:rod shape-determining protein MreC
MWRRTARDRVFIGLLVMATVTVLTVDFRTGLLEGVSSATTQAVGTVQGGVRAFVRPVEAVFETFSEFGSLREENRRLAEENRRLRIQTETFDDIARENTRLRTLLQLEGGSGLRGIHARVVGASLSGLERSALIDKGRSSGVATNRAVLAPEGLAGRVMSTGNDSSKVLLINDARSAVGVRIGSSGETGLVRGTGGGRLSLELVSRAALDQGAVNVGDVVVTSGYQGGIFPAGLPVGRVEQVTLAPRGVTYNISVRPFARLSQLDVVSVIVGTTEVIEPEPTPGDEETAS